MRTAKIQTLVRGGQSRMGVLDSEKSDECSIIIKKYPRMHEKNITTIPIESEIYMKKPRIIVFLVFSFFLKLFDHDKNSLTLFFICGGGTCRSRTGLQSFAGFCITALPRRHPEIIRKIRKKQIYLQAKVLLSAMYSLIFASNPSAK